MKRLLAIGLATAGTAAFVVTPAASAGASSPPNCFGQEVSTGAQHSAGGFGMFVSGYAHFFHAIGTSLGQTGIPFAKMACPTPPPPPPGG